MSKKSSGLGRGLEALIPKNILKAQNSQTEQAENPSGTQMLPLAQLEPNANQPRTHFEESALEELAQSIREKGLLQPILVRPHDNKYQIVAGERRYRASQKAGLERVPVVIRELSERETLEIALVENLQREDLGPLEEARAYKQLGDFGSPQEDIARAVGKARTTISNALRLLTLPGPAQNALENGDISAGHARAILAQPEEHRAWALERILSGGLTVRQAESLKFQAPSSTASATTTSTRPHRQLELELSRRVGTKVRIQGDKQGRIELQFHSVDELERILVLLGYEG